MSLQSWFWKVEPCSPTLENDSSSEWSVQEYESDSNSIDTTSTVVPSRADVAQQLLDDLEEYVKEEESSFSSWIEDEKLLPVLPIFDDITSVSTLIPHPTSNSLDITPLTTVNQDSFLKAGFTFTLGHLTPPQSPPAAIQSYPAIEQPTFVSLEPCIAEYGQDTYLPDVAREIAVVDEVVRGVAQQWAYLEASDSSSRGSSGSASPDESDDPEWQPDNEPSAKTTSRRGRRSRPYSTQDKRQRKKEQNKTAATRYRLKKKAEVNNIVDDERMLDEKNTNLRTKVTDLEKEICYLKSLMRDMFRAKGMLK